MRRLNLFAALATGVLFAAAASAPAQFHGGGHFGGHGFRRGHSGFGLGLGFGSRGFAPRRTTYQNAFTGDVAYAERAVNEFRAVYEKRGGDRLGIKADVQRLDQTMERLRREAEAFGAPTNRGEDLMRGVQSDADAIDRRFRDSDDSLRGRWDDALRLVDRLARSYRTG